MSFNARPAETHADAPGVDQSMLSRLLSALMDRIECGMFACDAEGRLFHANLAARRALDAGGMLTLHDGCVRGVQEMREPWSAALQDVVVRLRSRLLCSDESDERLMVALVPVPAESVGVPAALALMGRRSVCSPLGLEMLSSTHGLTFAESRVFRALVGNSSAREIAESHGVAVATVRTQIQAVRDKLGVRSIDALLLRAAEVPPVTARV